MCGQRLLVMFDTQTQADSLLKKGFQALFGLVISQCAVYSQYLACADIFMY